QGRGSDYVQTRFLQASRRGLGTVCISRGVAGHEHAGRLAVARSAADAGIDGSPHRTTVQSEDDHAHSRQNGAAQHSDIGKSRSKTINSRLTGLESNY